MALLPLSAVFQDDILALLVAVDDQDSVEVVGKKIAHHVVGRRIAPRPLPIRVRYQGQVLNPEQRIVDAGVGPLDHVEAFFDG